MDFIANLIDQVQKTDLFKIVQSFAVIDWIVVILVLWGILQGGRKGFGAMIGKILEILVIGVVVLTFSPKLSDFLKQLIPALPKDITDPVAFLVLGGLVAVLVTWCFNSIGKFVRIEISGSFKTLGGFLGGGIYFFLLLSFVSQFLLFFPVEAIEKSYKSGHSYTGPALARTMPAVQHGILSVCGLRNKTEVLPKAK